MKCTLPILIIIDDYFREIFTLHHCAPRFWLLGFLLYHRLWLCFRGSHLPVCVALNPNSPRASTAFVANSRFVQAVQHLADPQK